MKDLRSFVSLILGVAAIALISCNDPEPQQETGAKKEEAPTGIREESVTYTSDGVSLNGYLYYDAKEGSRPGILVVPEWWGLNEYTKTRAKQLAELGYIALAVDMYGNGKTAADPGEAGELAMPFYKDPALSKSRLDAALKKLQENSRTDSTKIAIIGYCFGGNAALNAAKLGANVKGVVSFHGGLAGPAPDKNLLKAKLLICHGSADQFVPEKEVKGFRKSLDSIGADYTFISYPGATHAFTNPASTETGKKFKMPISYNAAADSASWRDMKTFFGKIF